MPAGVLELNTHSSLEADPSKSSPPPVSVAPMVSPFLCLDDSESDSEIPGRHVSHTPHDAMLTRWRGKVASQSSSHTTSTLEIPTAPSFPAPSAIVAPSFEFPLALDIPIGRLYRTYPGGPCRALTTRKSVRPLPSHHLALRYTSHHLDHFTSGSSSSHSSLDHSFRHSILGYSLSGHTPPDTTNAGSSTQPRFIYLPLARTPRCSEAYLHWRSALLSTMYLPTTSESSTMDSSFESFARPYRKRCRSPTATVTSSIHAMRALVPSRADLLPPRKRFRDSISPKDSVEDDIDTNVLEDIEADATAIEVAEDRDVITGIDAVDVVVGIDIPDAMIIPDDVERLEQVEEGLQDIYDHVIEIPLQRIEDIETGQRELESRSLIASEERASLLEQNMTVTQSGMTPEAIEELVNRRVEEALAAYEATRAANALEAESQSQNGSDSDNGNGGNGNGRDGNGGDGNGGNGNGGNGNLNENNRDARHVVRECTYQDFMKYQPLNFKGTKGVVGLTRWFEKMETVFHISNCLEKYQVKYATCTLLNSALTWWNSHKRTIGTDAAFAMSWRELMKLMAEVYCPRNEIQKMESEQWNLTVKNNDLAAYTQRFQELTMLYTKMVPEEEDRVEKFIGALPDNIQGNCKTRSSTNELFKPYKEPKREVRSSRRHFKTLSLDEFRSPDFNLLSNQEYSEEEEAEAMAETMEQYMSKTRTDYGSGVDRPKIDNKDQFELKGQFLKELRENTFNGLDNEDANKHIEKVLEIVDLFHVPNITEDQLMLRVFPISLTRAQEPDETLYQAWERFKELLIKCPQHYLTEMQEVILFYNGLDVPTRQILDSRGAVLTKTTEDAKKDLGATQITYTIIFGYLD
ncbi:reverse transcriptase domain-containing protein [Tanacetum coccineum]